MEKVGINGNRTTTTTTQNKTYLLNARTAGDVDDEKAQLLPESNNIDRAGSHLGIASRNRNTGGERAIDAKHDRLRFRWHHRHQKIKKRVITANIHLELIQSHGQCLLLGYRVEYAATLVGQLGAQIDPLAGARASHMDVHLLARQGDHIERAVGEATRDDLFHALLDHHVVGSMVGRDILHPRTHTHTQMIR